MFSFESFRSRTGLVEVTGAKGTLAFPDPNRFDGATTVFDAATPDGTEYPAVGSLSGRGTGVAELAQAIRAGRPERASGEQAFHVLDLMVSIAESAACCEPVLLSNSFTKAPPVHQDWDPKVATN